MKLDEGWTKRGRGLFPHAARRGISNVAEMWALYRTPACMHACVALLSPSVKLGPGCTTHALAHWHVGLRVDDRGLGCHSNHDRQGIVPHPWAELFF